MLITRSDVESLDLGVYLNGHLVPLQCKPSFNFFSHTLSLHGENDPNSKTTPELHPEVTKVYDCSCYAFPCVGANYEWLMKTCTFYIAKNGQPRDHQGCALVDDTAYDGWLVIAE